MLSLFHPSHKHYFQENDQCSFLIFFILFMFYKWCINERIIYFNNKIAITFSNFDKWQVLNWCSIMLTQFGVELEHWTKHQKTIIAKNDQEIRKCICFMSQPHFGQVCGVKPNTSKVGDLESFGTPECLEFDSKAQNTLHWGVLGVIGKVLKRRYRKWPRIGHLDI